MRLASYVISLCLHGAVFLLIWFWPAGSPVSLDRPAVMISLVDGAPGGNRTPSPILGHVGEPGEEPLAPTPPAPKNEIAAPAREEVREPKPIPTPVKTPEPVSKPELKPEPRPESKPEPRRDDVPVPRDEKEDPKKKETPKEERKGPPPRQEPPKPTPPKQEKAKSKPDPVAQALKEARRKATSRADSGDRGNAIEQALAQAKRRAGGNRGGGGGEGEGPGGGGLGDVYMGQVMLAVRPNWGFSPGARRLNLVCVVKVRVDMRGNVLEARLGQGSGNVQFDGAAVNAVIRTGQAGQFPPPPSPEYGDLELVFTLDELMGR